MNAAFGNLQHPKPILTAILTKARQKYHFPWYVRFKERHVIKKPLDRIAYPGPADIEVRTEAERGATAEALTST